MQPSSKPFENAATRLTYDWLIRYVELLPSEASKNAHLSISPMFTRLVDRYSCKFANHLCLTNCSDMASFLPTLRKTVITKYYADLSTYSGTITMVFQAGLQLCRLKNLCLDNGTITPDELMYMLKGQHEKILMHKTLTEPVRYSSLLPYLSKSMEVSIHTPNMIYDDCFPETRNDKASILSNLSLSPFPVDQKLCLRFVESVLAASGDSKFIWIEFAEQVTDEFAVSTLETAREMVKEAGFCIIEPLTCERKTVLSVCCVRLGNLEL
uniref:F-box/LRR-repeat protein n=1 Tax=Panagrellus redivivus TaxID=6233 RepID=A0A7E4V3M1_PANRE